MLFRSALLPICALYVHCKTLFVNYRKEEKNIHLLPALLYILFRLETVLLYLLLVGSEVNNMLLIFYIFLNKHNI